MSQKSLVDKIARSTETQVDTADIAEWFWEARPLSAHYAVVEERARRFRCQFPYSTMQRRTYNAVYNLQCKLGNLLDILESAYNKAKASPQRIAHAVSIMQLAEQHIVRAVFCTTLEYLEFSNKPQICGQSVCPS